MADGEKRSKPITVELAISEKMQFGYARRRVDLRLSDRQAHALRVLTKQLSADDARLLNGKRVFRPSTAVKWLLENIASQMEDVVATQPPALPKVEEPAAAEQTKPKRKRGRPRKVRPEEQRPAQSGGSGLPSIEPPAE